MEQAWVEEVNRGGGCNPASRAATKRGGRGVGKVDSETSA